MGFRKYLVCFAKSWKNGGDCIAGREKHPEGWGQWIRPISSRPTHEISYSESRYTDGSSPVLLDVMHVGFDSPRPRVHQRENHLIDGTTWARVGALSWADVQNAVDHTVGPLWLNGSSSSKGTNDRVPEAALQNLPRSLVMVRPKELRLVSVQDPFKGTTQVRARFWVASHEYCLSMTDRAAEARFPVPAGGEIALGDALLCVSLAEALNGFAYKLAAAVIVP